MVHSALLNICNRIGKAYATLILYFAADAYLVVRQLTPRNEAPLEKLTDTRLVKKFPAFHRTRRFITVLVTARHWSLS